MLCYGKTIRAGDGHVAHGDSRRKDEPHVILYMTHSYKGDERISRGEIFAVLSMMMTQLDHDALQSHYITPVSELP